MSVGLKRFGKLVGITLFCLSSAFISSVNAQNTIQSKVNTAAAQNSQQYLEEIRKRGFASLKTGDWESAKKNFGDALAIAPQDPLSLYGNSVALFNLKNYSEASQNLETGIEILSKSNENNDFLADFLVLSSVISAVKKENSAAIAKLEKAISLVPNHFDANFSLGRAYFGNGDIDKAVNSFRKAAAIRPRDARARFFLANALERAGNTQEALAEYRTVLEIDPKNADGNLGLGVLLIKTNGNNSEEGLKALLKAIELNADLYEAQIALGKAFIRLNRNNEAIEHLKKAAELAPNNPEPHFQLAIAYRKLGNKTQADAETEIVKKIHESRRGVSSSKPH